MSGTGGPFMSGSESWRESEFVFGRENLNSAR